MKKPANAPVIPLLNPALPPYQRLLEDGRPFRFCYNAVVLMGEHLTSWASSHKLPLKRVIMLQAEPELLYSTPKKYDPVFLQTLLEALNFPTQMLWVAVPGERKPSALLVLPAGKVLAFKRAEKEQEKKRSELKKQRQIELDAAAYQQAISENPLAQFVEPEVTVEGVVQFLSSLNTLPETNDATAEPVPLTWIDTELARLKEEKLRNDISDLFSDC